MADTQVTCANCGKTNEEHTEDDYCTIYSLKAHRYQQLDTKWSPLPAPQPVRGDELRELREK